MEGQLPLKFSQGLICIGSGSLFMVQDHPPHVLIFHRIYIQFWSLNLKRRK